MPDRHRDERCDDETPTQPPLVDPEEHHQSDGERHHDLAGERPGTEEERRRPVPLDGERADGTQTEDIREDTRAADVDLEDQAEVQRHRETQPRGRPPSARRGTPQAALPRPSREVGHQHGPRDHTRREEAEPARRSSDTTSVDRDRSASRSPKRAAQGSGTRDRSPGRRRTCHRGRSSVGRDHIAEESACVRRLDRRLHLPEPRKMLGSNPTRIRAGRTIATLISESNETNDPEQRHFSAQSWARSVRRRSMSRPGEHQGLPHDVELTGVTPAPASRRPSGGRRLPSGKNQQERSRREHRDEGSREVERLTPHMNGKHGSQSDEREGAPGERKRVRECQDREGDDDRRGSEVDDEVVRVPGPGSNACQEPDERRREDLESAADARSLPPIVTEGMRTRSPSRGRGRPRCATEPAIVEPSEDEQPHGERHHHLAAQRRGREQDRCRQAICR